MHYTTLIFSILLFTAAIQGERDDMRLMCPNNYVGYQCSEDCTQLGYCDNYNYWVAIGMCPTGTLCIGSSCVVSSTCPTAPTTPVECADSSLKMPNLEDETCNTYYNCEISTGSIVGNGVLQRCPAGTVFDSCSGECVYGSCPPYWYGCTFDFQILPTNPRLAYICTMEGTIIWATCPYGIFLWDAGPECYQGLSFCCPNGGVGSGGRNTCTTAGRFPVAGTDCGYVQCDSDLSSALLPCKTGYRYDEAAKDCVAGACTDTSRILRDNAANGQK